MVYAFVMPFWSNEVLSEVYPSLLWVERISRTSIYVGRVCLESGSTSANSRRLWRLGRRYYELKVIFYFIFFKQEPAAFAFPHAWHLVRANTGNALPLSRSNSVLGLQRNTLHTHTAKPCRIQMQGSALKRQSHLGWPSFATAVCSERSQDNVRIDLICRGL